MNCVIYFPYRCVQDETLTVYPSNQTSFNFAVEAFMFTGNYYQVTKTYQHKQKYSKSNYVLNSTVYVLYVPQFS